MCSSPLLQKQKFPQDTTEFSTIFTTAIIIIIIMDSAGAKSNLSNDMQELTQGKEQTTNTIRGHKANLSNPSKNTPLRCYCTGSAVDKLLLIKTG